MVNAKTSFILVIHSLLWLSCVAHSPDSLLQASKNALDLWKLSEAKQLAYDALQLAQNSGNQPLEALASYRLANAFQASENLQGAEPHYQRALELADVLADSTLLAKSLCGFSALRQKQGNLTEALNNAQLSLKVAGALKDTSMLMYANLQLGNIKAEEGKLKRAVEHYVNAAHLAESHGSSNLLAGIKQNLSEAQAQQQQWDLAQRLAMESIQLRISLGDAYHVNKCFENLLAQKVRKEDYEAFVAVQALFLKTLGEHEMQMTSETAAALAEMSQIHNSHADRTRKWMVFIGFTLLLLFGVLIAHLVKTLRARKKLLERLELSALRIRQMESTGPTPSMAEHVKPLRSHSNSMLTSCYLMLSVGYTRSELSDFFGRDRATIHRWIEQMGRVLNVEDAEADAVQFGHHQRRVLLK